MAAWQDEQWGSSLKTCWLALKEGIRPGRDHEGWKSRTNIQRGKTATLFNLGSSSGSGCSGKDLKSLINRVSKQKATTLLLN